MKTCKNCNVIFDGTNFYVYKRIESYCKECRKAINYKNKIKRGIKAKEKGYTSLFAYRMATDEKFKKAQTEKYKPIENARSILRMKKIREELKTPYIKELICRKNKQLRGVQIPQELIELVRANLLLKRSINDNRKT